MRLVGIALAHQDPRRQRRGAGRTSSGAGRAWKALEQLLELRRSSDSPSRLPTANARAAGRRPAARAERDDRIAGEGVADVLGRAQHRASERVVAEHGLVDQVLGHDRRLVVGARDLLHDHAALAVDLVAVDSRPADEVGQQVRRLHRLRGARGDVEGDEIVARVRVEHRADPLGGLVDVAVGRVLLAALEHQVLEEVSHAVLVGALGARAGIERDQDRHRSRSLDRDPIQRQAVVSM